MRTIDADALTKTLIPLWNCHDDSEFANKDIWQEIEKAPTIEPERKTGKWERHYCEDGNADGWQCDQCGDWYYFGNTTMNFCPNCGADMRGDNDEIN